MQESNMMWNENKSVDISHFKHSTQQASNHRLTNTEYWIISEELWVSDRLQSHQQQRICPQHIHFNTNNNSNYEYIFSFARPL